MVLIEMEMPRDCEECPLNDEYAECALLGKFVAKCGRLPDCPLREVEIEKLSGVSSVWEYILTDENEPLIEAAMIGSIEKQLIQQMRPMIRYAKDSKPLATLEKDMRTLRGTIRVLREVEG